MRELNTFLLVGIGLLVIYLGVTGRLANVPSAWNALKGGQ